MKFYKAEDEMWYCQKCMDEGYLDDLGGMNIIDSSTDPFGHLQCYGCGMFWSYEEKCYIDANGYEWDDDYEFGERKKGE